MVSKLAREVRCTDVLRRFAEDNDGMCFLTLTTPDVVTIHQIRERWRNLRHDLVRRLGRDAKYVMNYELHPRGHGWHIHAVFNRYIPLRRGGLYRLRSFGFRMIRVEKVTTEGVALYLSKHCLKAYRGVSKQLQGQSKRLRLVNCSVVCLCCLITSGSLVLSHLSVSVFKTGISFLRSRSFRSVFVIVMPSIPFSWAGLFGGCVLSCRKEKGRRLYE